MSARRVRIRPFQLPVMPSQLHIGGYRRGDSPVVHGQDLGRRRRPRGQLQSLDLLVEFFDVAVRVVGSVGWLEGLRVVIGAVGAGFVARLLKLLTGAQCTCELKSVRQSSKQSTSPMFRSDQINGGGSKAGCQVQSEFYEKYVGVERKWWLNRTVDKVDCSLEIVIYLVNPCTLLTYQGSDLFIFLFKLSSLR